MKGVDTNVLLRVIVRDDERQAALADAFLEESCSRQTPCLVNRHVLCEFDKFLSILGLHLRYSAPRRPWRRPPGPAAQIAPTPSKEHADGDRRPHQND